MTTVCCVYVHGHVKDFRPEYVIKLASMVSRHMDGRPYRFVCLTDDPDRLYVRGIDIIGIPPPADLPKRMPPGYSAGKHIYGWWSKLSIFDTSHGFTDRVLYLDLDSLVVDSLAPLLDYPAPVALIPHAGDFNGRYGLQVVKRFNSSVMVFTPSDQTAALFTKWNVDVAARLHGDQDWLGEQLPDAATLPAEWCPRISALGNTRPKPPAKIVLCKWPKNTLAAEMYPWVREVWA
jgi:hypothetical protein